MRRHSTDRGSRRTTIRSSSSSGTRANTTCKRRLWQGMFVAILTLNGLLLPFTIITVANEPLVSFEPAYQYIPDVKQTKRWMASIADASIHWNNTTAWWWETPLSSNNTTTSQIGNETASTKNNYLVTAIIVELQCHAALSLVLQQAATFLGKQVRIVVFHAAHNQKFVQGIIQVNHHLRALVEQERLRLQLIGNPESYGSMDTRTMKDGRYWYSRMLTSAAFWQTMPTPYVMTLQADTLLCRPFVPEEFLLQNVSFVGGLTGYKRIPQYPVPVTANPDYGTPIKWRHKRGALSLRNVQWTMECLQRWPNINDQYAEDFLYRHCAEMEIKGTVHVNELQAYSFASELGTTLCFDAPATAVHGQGGGPKGRICPVGVHKPWVSAVSRWGQAAYEELVQNCPGLAFFAKLHSMKVIQGGGTCHSYDITGNATAFPCDCSS